MAQPRVQPDGAQAPERRLIVVSAPSGAGKHSVLSVVIDRNRNLMCAVSATTREPRPGEEHGRDYYFISRDEFLRRKEAGEFIEWAEVHGNLYGTLKSEIERLQAGGSDVVLEVDVQGMRSLQSQGLDIVSVFIEPPSMAELERRLRGRGTDSDETIALRLRNAEEEMARRNAYHYVIVNDDLDAAVRAFERVLAAEREQTE